MQTDERVHLRIDEYFPVVGQQKPNWVEITDLINGITAQGRTVKEAKHKLQRKLTALSRHD
jgi:hypothetical protein